MISFNQPICQIIFLILKRYSLLLVVLLFVLGGYCGQTSSDAQELLPQCLLTNGKQITGAITNIDAQRKVALRQQKNIEHYDLEQIVRWGKIAQAKKGAQILLTGGGILIGSIQSIENDQLLIKSRLFGTMKIPLDFVLAILFKPTSDQSQYEKILDQVYQNNQQTDRLLVANGDQLRGVLVKIDDHPKKNTKLIHIKTKSGQVSSEIDHSIALLMDPSLLDSQPSSSSTLLGFSDGSRIRAKTIKYDKNSKQISIQAYRSRLVVAQSALTYLQQSGGPITYLSDLKPTAYDHQPFFNLRWGYRFDRTVTGKTLRAGGRIYSKGIAMHSTSMLTFRLKNRQKLFQAELALDDSTKKRGSVIFAVSIDDAAGNWKSIYKSPIIRGGDKPLSISLDIVAAKKLRLKVLAADQADVMDRAVWLDARVIKK